MTEERKPMSVARIVAAALELPEGDREEIIRRVQATLTDDDVDQAWRAEVRRRLARIETGDVEWIDGEEVMAELRADP